MRVAIPSADEAVLSAACRRLDSLTKPLGALGRLESLAARICAAQGTLTPSIEHPLAVVFAADHGIANRGVSAYPPAVTEQMVRNFLAGGAAINVLSRLVGLELWIVDAGVDGDCGPHPRLVEAKIRRGTRDFVTEAAMTSSECQDALERGRRVIHELMPQGGNIVVLGEMGIGNTASAALLMHGLTQLPLADCVGRGTGLDDAGVAKKREILSAARERWAPTDEPVALLTEFGGYEIAMMAGAVLGSAMHRRPVIVDGFIATAAALVAIRLRPAARDYCIFSHRSAERGHDLMLDALGVQPYLDLGLRLGEGTGAVMAVPLLRAAAGILNEMADLADVMAGTLQPFSPDRRHG